MGTDEDRRIPSTTLAVLRGILIKSLSRENLSEIDKKLLQKSTTSLSRRVSFKVAGNKDATIQQQQQKHPSRPSSVNKDSSYITADVQREREERIKQIKENQNVERQRKLEDLKAQALAAQKFREQKEEERRHRIEELRNRDNDRRQQVEERKKAIWEAEKERREYLLRKNQERDHRLESKRRSEKSQIQFAFGSSTPRMIDGQEGNAMSSSFWVHRRATSITNVAYTGAPLSRRSSERELVDGSKKRATSASGLDRQSEDFRRMSSSMYEVFHWGNSECPKKQLPLSIAGSEIIIDRPPPPLSLHNAAKAPGNSYYESITNLSVRHARPRSLLSMCPSRSSLCMQDFTSLLRNQREPSKDDSNESAANYQRHVNRRKTDLMPTIPSPRDSSRSSIGTHTPRTPGRAVSLTRLDQLATPLRRNGEHISAILERERKHANDIETDVRRSLSRGSPINGAANDIRKSRSMSQLAGTARPIYKLRNKSGSRSPISGGAMRKTDTSKSMSQLDRDDRNNKAMQASSVLRSSRKARSERLRQQVKEHLNGSTISGAGTPSSSAGLRSGEVTPSNMSSSRPGSSMSNSTTASGIVRRSNVGGSAPRKPRPASIAVTGVSLTAFDSPDKKSEKPPIPTKSHSASRRPLSASYHTNKSSEGINGSNHSIKKTSSSTAAHEKRTSSVRSSATTTPKATTPQLQSPATEHANKSIGRELASIVSIEEKKVKQPKDKVVVAVKKEDSSLESSDATVVENQQPTETVNVNVEVAASTATSETEITQNVNNKHEITNNVADKDTKDKENIEKKQIAVEEQQQQQQPPPPAQQPERHQSHNDLLDLSASIGGGSGDMMTASMMAKKITTEEEAKAALAERRRLAREEAERQAELERQRMEAEDAAEYKRQLEEEERQRTLEEEANRLGLEQRRAEEERLQQAIQEAQKRDEEERLRKEDEARQKIEREETERKMREEAEKQRQEMEERLKQEEKARQERKKRIDEIMARTRGKGSANNTPSKNPDSEKMTESMTKSQLLEMTQSFTEETTISVDQSNNKIEQQPIEASPAVVVVEQPNVTVDVDQPQQPTTTPDNVNKNGRSNEVVDNSINQQPEQQSPNNNQHGYEQSVTEKENLLLMNSGGFANNMHNNHHLNQNDTNILMNSENSFVESAFTNGKSTTTIAGDSNPFMDDLIQATTELIIEDVVINNGQQHTNGHKNIDNNVFNNKQLPVVQQDDTTATKNITSHTLSEDILTGRLIDFNNINTTTTTTTTIITDDPLNFNDNNNHNNNNNNNNLTNNATILVASDSQDNRDLSLL